MALVNQTVSTVSTMEGKSMTVDLNNRFLFQAMINIYQDPHTFIREVTANAYDAVVELWERDYKGKIDKNDFLNENPIVIGLFADDSGNYLEIKETRGIGMSEERMKSYLEAGLSSKRDSEHQIGAKGIGRLSAFAYASEYYITTVYDGIKYFYMAEFYGNTPKIIKLNSVPTNEVNHTAIKVRLKGDTRDEKKVIEDYINNNLYLFKNLVTKQLNFKSPFEDFYVETDDYFLIKNHPNRELGYNSIIISLGNIPYIVNLNKLTYHAADLKVSTADINLINSLGCVIKFEPSDLDVTASRDSLELNKRTQDKLVERLRYVVKLIQEYVIEDFIFSKSNFKPRVDKTFLGESCYFSQNFNKNITIEILKIDLDGKESHKMFIDNVRKKLLEISEFIKNNSTNNYQLPEYVYRQQYSTFKNKQLLESLRPSYTVYNGDLKSLKKFVKTKLECRDFIFKNSVVCKKYYDDFIKYYCRFQEEFVENTVEVEEDDVKDELKFYMVYNEKLTTEFRTANYKSVIPDMEKSPDDYAVMLYDNNNKLAIIQAAGQIVKFLDKKIVLMTTSKFTKKYKMLQNINEEELKNSITISVPDLKIHYINRWLFKIYDNAEKSILELEKLKHDRNHHVLVEYDSRYICTREALAEYILFTSNIEKQLEFLDGVYNFKKTNNDSITDYFLKTQEFFSNLGIINKIYKLDIIVKDITDSDVDNLIELAKGAIIYKIVSSYIALPHEYKHAIAYFLLSCKNSQYIDSRMREIMKMNISEFVEYMKKPKAIVNAVVNEFYNQFQKKNN